MKKIKIIDIAEMAHELHLSLCKKMGMDTQHKWATIDPDHMVILINGITGILMGMSKNAEESHNMFVANKGKQGWSFGITYSLTDKTNPRLCNWENLSGEDKIKETVFFNFVSSFINNYEV